MMKLANYILPMVPFVFSLNQTVKAENKRVPNILFCLADDVSFPYMGAYGTSWVRTPHFDRVAQEGALFVNAYTCNSKSGPSRSSILTGRNSWQLEAACNHFAHFPETFKTFTEVLAEHSYQVAMTGKGWAPGDPGKVNGKPRQLIGKEYQEHKLIPPSSGISNNDYAANFAHFLNEKDNSKPFFFWYGSLEPHREYEYGSSLRENNYQVASIDCIPSYWPDNDTVRTDMLDFAFELEHFDSHLGQMIKLLEERGELDNTIIIVTADNGMAFPRIKGQAYHASNHLPMAVWWKNGMINTQKVIESYVTFADLAPTFLEVAGVTAQESGMKSFAGKSILPLIKDTSLDKEWKKEYAHAIVGKERHDIGRPNDWGYPIRAIKTDNYLYIHNFEPERWPAGNPTTGYLNCDGGAIKSYLIENQTFESFYQLNFGKRPQEELYDLKNDPDCIYNLTSDKKYKNIAKQLQKRLFQQLLEEGDPRMYGKGEEFEAMPYSNPVHLNYYNRLQRGENVEFPSWINRSDVMLEDN